MRIRITIVLAVALMSLTGIAAAQYNGMGLFFSDTEFTDATTNAAAGAEPLELYIVVLDCSYASVGQYECGITFDGPQPTVLGADGPAGAGWTNFGDDDLDHRVLFTEPPVAVGGAVVLAVLTIEATSPSVVEILLGPASVNTFPGLPMVGNGVDPDDIVACGLTHGGEVPGIVATINGGGITPTDPRNWTAIRSLFR